MKYEISRQITMQSNHSFYFVLRLSHWLRNHPANLFSQSLLMEVYLDELILVKLNDTVIQHPKIVDAVEHCKPHHCIKYLKYFIHFVVVQQGHNFLKHHLRNMEVM